MKGKIAVPIHWQTLKHLEPLLRDVDFYIYGRKKPGEWIYHTVCSKREIVAHFDVSGDIVQVKKGEFKSPFSTFYRYGLVALGFFSAGAVYLGITYSISVGVLGLLPILLLLSILIWTKRQFR